MVITQRQVQTQIGPIWLASDEELVPDKPPVESRFVLPAVREHPMHVMLRLGRVNDMRQLGTRALIASVTNPENMGNWDVRLFERPWVRDMMETARPLRHLRQFRHLEPNLSAYALAFIADDADWAKQSERGKIANHLRPADDPLAVYLTRENGRGWPWYGSTDATPLTIAAEARAIARDPRRASRILIHPEDGLDPGKPVIYRGRPLTHGRALIEAIGWLVRHLDDEHGANLLWCPLNLRDSFTYWRDSPTAFCHADGTLAKVPVAPLGLQTIAIEALLEAAAVVDDLPAECSVDDITVSGSSLQELARAVRGRVLRDYLVRDGLGYYLADAVEPLDGNGVNPLQRRTIDLGRALNSPLLDGPECEYIVDDICRVLMSEEFRTPFGLTCIPRSDPRFDELDYHVQPWGKAIEEAADGYRRRRRPWAGLELDARVMRQTADGLNVEYVGGSLRPVIQYCWRTVTVSRPTYEGKIRTTQKQRPQHTEQAWQTGAVIGIDARGQQLLRVGIAPATGKDAELIARIAPDERAFTSPIDLTWDSTGERLARYSGIDTAIAPSQAERYTGSDYFGLGGLGGPV